MMYRKYLTYLSKAQHNGDRWMTNPLNDNITTIRCGTPRHCVLERTPVAMPLYDS